jgi:hypothetical protein
MRKIIALLCVGLGLAACDPHASITCPALKSYSFEFQKAAAGELDKVMRDAPHLSKMLKDYGVTRQAIRACIEHRNGH